MHPRHRLLLDLLKIAPNPRRLHGNQHPRLPRRLDDSLAPGPADLIVRREGVGDEFGVVDFAEEGFEDEGVFDGLAGALALVGGGSVGGVSHHGYVAEGVCGGGEVVAHGPHGQVGVVHELDEAVGRWAPAGEKFVELGFGGWEDALVAFPAWILKVHGYNVEDFAKVDRIAEKCFAWVTVSVIVFISGVEGQRTRTAKQHRIAGVLIAQLLHGFVHWNKGSVSDRACKDSMAGYIFLSKDVCACDAVNAVRANNSICCGRGTVLEMENKAAAFFFLETYEALVEVCTSSRNSFDELIEEVSSMDALHAAFRRFLADHCTIVFAFALMMKTSICFQHRIELSPRDCTMHHLRQRAPY